MNNGISKADLKSLYESVRTLEKQNAKLESELLLSNAKIENYEHYYSYRLGRLIVTSNSFLKILLLPFNIYRLRKKYKQQKYKDILGKLDHSLSFASDNRKANNKKFGKMIVIFDEISELSWKNEFQIFPLNIANYEEQINTSTSNALFLESCWNGNEGKWKYAFTSPELKHKNAQTLLKAIDLAKKRELPIIFWNKEDPMHYERFLPIAKKCDVIFTTDVNKVASYREDVPTATVATLPFAANIRLCNPMGRFNPNNQSDTVCFAGSYYTVGHEDRKRQMDRILPIIIDFDGVIYDRMSEQEGDRYQFPVEYKEYIKSSLPFSQIIESYKKFKIFLNVNTITDSPTMMSRRVYELLACGTPVISTPSLALETQFPGIVQIANNVEEAREIAQKLLDDPLYWDRISHLGYREVMLKHTYEDRARLISTILGKPVKHEDPMISIIMATNRPKFIDRIVENISRQDYKKLEVIFVVQGYTEEEVGALKSSLLKKASFINNVEIIIDNSENTLGHRLNMAGDIAKGDYIAKMDDDDLYFSHYFTDMLLPFKFSDCEIVGKKEIFVYLEGADKIVRRFVNERHKYSNFIAGPTIMMKKEVLSKIRFGDKNKGEDSSFLNSAIEKNIKVYASDPFNFIQWRSAEKQDHTWQVDDGFFLEKGEVVSDGMDLENIVL